jgi:16S rRNA (cytosine967-C5)-methyltransferase
MTPGARLSAAIALIDQIIAGEPVERALTRWARASRYAGSKDRAAVRDLVFDAIRRRRSLGWRGGGDTGRAIVLAGQAVAGENLDALFTGDGYDPAPVSDEEREILRRDLAGAPAGVRWDMPDFLLEELGRSLGDRHAEVFEEMQVRAPTDLRVNTLKTTREAAMVVLARDGVGVVPLPDMPTALRVVDNPRLVSASRAYTQGMIELQDVSSQRAAAFAGAEPGMTVLDYCTGGGGKALAIAAAMRGEGRLLAWDMNRRRMKDLPERVRRAGARIEVLLDADPSSLGPVCDLVFVDAPCSGTGAWRRKPEGKWLLTPKRLAAFPGLQDRILDSARRCVRPGGRLVYATCSFLARENEDRVAAFLLRHPGWRLEEDLRLSPLDAGDGFYTARLAAPS